MDTKDKVTGDSSGTAAATVEAAPVVKAEDIAAVVDAWFNERLKQGVIARNTDAYTQAFQAKADLVARLVKAFTPAPPAQ